MNRITWLTIIVIIGIFDIAKSQHKSNIFPQIGTNYVMAVADVYPTKRIHVREFSNKVWDFSAFIPKSFETVRTKLPKRTKYGKRFPQSNIAMYKTPTDIEYLVVDSNKVYVTGIIGDFMEKKLPVLLEFKDTLLCRSTDFKFQKVHIDTATTRFVSPYFYKPGVDSIKANVWYIMNIKRDAKGTLITPYQEYQVEREAAIIIKDVRGFKFDRSGWVPAPEYSIKKRFMRYRWYLEGDNMPVAEAQSDAKGIIRTVRYRYNSPLQLSFTIKHVICKGDSSGAIFPKITGGIPDYEYLWNTGAVSQNLLHVKAGTYTLTATDNRGQKITSRFTVTEPSVELHAKIDATNVSCRGMKNGKVKLRIIGGENPYEFKWSNNSLSDTLNDLKPCRLYVKIKDSGGCIIIDSVTITQPESKLMARIKTEKVTCHGGSGGVANISTSGGTAPYCAKWFDGDTLMHRKDLKFGHYKVTIIDKNNCTIEKEVDIEQAEKPIKIAKNIKNVSCYDGSDGKIDLEVTGGKAPFKYKWQDSSTRKNRSSLKAGFYKLAIRDENNCVVNETINIEQPESPLSINYDTKDVACYAGNDGEIKIKVSGGSGGYKYLWSNGQDKASLKKLIAGVYKITVTDKNACFLKDTIRINQPKNPLVINVEKSNSTCKGCNDGKIRLRVSGGTPDYNYIWSNKKKTGELSDLKPGVYSVKVTDSKKCIKTGEYEIGIKE